MTFLLSSFGSKSVTSTIPYPLGQSKTHPDSRGGDIDHFLFMKECQGSKTAWGKGDIILAIFGK